MYSSIIIAALSAVAFWIVVDSASKLYIKKLGKELASVAVLAAGIIPMLLLFIAYGTFNLSNVSLLLAVGAAGGAALFLGYLFVYKSVPEGGVANSYMLVEVQPPLLILFGIFALGEHLSALQLVSMIVIFAGVSLIVFTKELRLDRRLAPALAGNVMWAAYWFIVVLAVLHYRNFIAPLLLVRIFGTIFAYAYYKYAKSKHAAHSAPKMHNIGFAMMALALLAGIFDGSGNLLFSFVAFSNRLAIGSAILSMEPIIIWFVGFLAYKESITRLQKVGFAISVVGYMLLSIL